jgi:hypothetical protein
MMLPMGPQKSPASEDPFGILFLTRRGSRKSLEIGRTGRLSVVYQHDADDSYVTLIGRGVIIADRALLRARWQPAWNRFFPAGVDDETSMFVQLEAERVRADFRGRFNYPTRTRRYLFRDGTTKPVNVSVHPDPRVQAVVEQGREAEMVQAIDRLRLIHNEKRKTVFILCNIPLDLPVDELARANARSGFTVTEATEVRFERA